MYQTEIQKGADLLDQKRGKGWENEIKPYTFDMRHPKHCVLGQLYGDYHLGLDALGLTIYTAMDYGFNIDPESDDDFEIHGYGPITSEWSRFILGRLAEMAVNS